MSKGKLGLSIPDPLADFLCDGRLKDAMAQLARLAEAELILETRGPDAAARTEECGDRSELPICHGGESMGSVFYQSTETAPAIELAARTLGSLMEHMLERELTVSDLAQALMTGYEELNLLYTLLPSVSTKVDPREIGEVLVAETARSLRCRRVSLLVLDEDHKMYNVLASRGLPPEIRGVTFPVAESVASHALWDEDLLVVNDVSHRPDLVRLSRGTYESSAFAVVRVPLIARGEALGFFAVTERTEGSEFTAHDRKLLEGLSAMGASALMNCRLHAAVKKQMLSTIHALASAVDAKDQYTHDHAGRVAQLCVATARKLGIADAKAVQEVELAGLLHDIGKIGIRDAILSKPSGLTPQEFATMQDHAKIGARIVAKVPGLEGVAKAILHHHERHDGLGYPDGLAGDAIPQTSSIIAVADVFDAITSDRPYRKRADPEHALKELNRYKGTHFAPDVVDAFVAVVKEGGDLPTPTVPEEPEAHVHRAQSPVASSS